MGTHLHAPMISPHVRPRRYLWALWVYEWYAVDKGMCWGAPAHAGRLSRSPCGIIQNNSLNYFDDYLTKKWKIISFQKNVDKSKLILDKVHTKNGNQKKSPSIIFRPSGVPIPSGVCLAIANDHVLYHSFPRCRRLAVPVYQLIRVAQQ